MKLKIKNKNFPSNDTYFGETTEHLYKHTIKIGYESIGNGAFYFDLYTNNSQPFDIQDQWKEIIKCFKENYKDTYYIAPAYGICNEGIANEISYDYTTQKDELVITFIDPTDTYLVKRHFVSYDYGNCYDIVTQIY